MSKREDAFMVAVLAQIDAARIACRVAGLPMYAIDDIVTDAVIVTWRAAQKGRLNIEQVGHVRGFLFVVAKRMAWRWKKRRIEVHREGAEAEGPDPMPQFEARDELDRIAELLHTDAAKLLKAFGEGLTGADIAAKLTPVGTVYTRKRWAKKAFGAGFKRDAAAERVLLHKTPRKPRRK